MGTIASQLRMNDGMSSVMRGISSTLNTLIGGFREMEAVSGESIDTSALDQAQTQLDEINRELIEMSGNSKRAGDSASSAFDSAAKSAEGFLKKIVSMGGAYLGISSAKKYLDSAFGRMDTMSSFQRTISIMTGDEKQGAAALAVLKDAVMDTAYGLGVAARATQGFVSRGMGLKTATDRVRVFADAVSFYGKGRTTSLKPSRT